MTQLKERHGISKSLKRFFGIGDFGFALMANIDTYYASFFFTNIAKFSLSVYTISTTISAVVDAILSCVYGAWLNKIKPHKWGRYRSWLILTPWLVPFLYAMQFIKLSDGIWGITFITIAMITSRIAWNIPFIANIAMIHVASKDTTERMQLSSSRMVYTTLASVVYSYVGPAAVAFFAGMLGEAHSYAATAFAFSALMAAGYYAHFRMFEGYEEPGEAEIQRLAKEAAERKEAKKAQKVSAIAAITCNPHLIGLLVASITKYMAMFLVNGLAIYYFKYVAHNDALFATFIFAANLLAVFASYISKFVVAKIGAKRTVVLSFFLMAAVMVGAFLVYTQIALVIALMCVMMFAVRMTNSCDPELFAACSIYSSKKLGYDTTGTIMGLLAVPIKVGVISRGILIAMTLSIAGFDAAIAPELASATMQRGISMGFTIIPAVTVLIGAVIMLFGYRLKGEEHA
ncbi:MAG: MFS transporter [Oscillospiraceae bacterium]